VRGDSRDFNGPIQLDSLLLEVEGVAGEAGELLNLERKGLVKPGKKIINGTFLFLSKRRLVAN
jgi:hypothetical protein